MSEQADSIYSQLNGRVGELVLNRPSSRNAISRDMWLAIPRHLKMLKLEGATLVVVRGTGGSFAAGADIAELKELGGLEDASQNWDAIADALNFLYGFELPTVAAIDGPCLGGGCLLACACDLRYASARSSFSVPIARLGIVLDDANLGRLASLVGVGRAKELICRARRLTAMEALSWGLINEVFGQDEFPENFARVLAEIMENSLVSMKEAKSSFERFTAFASDPNNRAAVVESYLLPDAQLRIKKALRRD